MPYVSDVTETVGSNVVTFECPLCSEEETEVFDDEEDRVNIRHSCSTENVMYPLFPTVSLTGESLASLSVGEQVEMQLASVAVARPFASRYRITSQELLFALHGAFTAIVAGAVGIVNALFMAAVFSSLLQSNLLLLAIYLIDVLLLALGIVAVWGLWKNVQVAIDYVEVNNIDMTSMQFIASVGNYYNQNPFKQRFVELGFLYPSGSIGDADVSSEQ